MPPQRGHNRSSGLRTPRPPPIQHVVRGHRLRDEIVECDALAFGRSRVTFPVTTCTEYVNRQHPSIREMEDIAWVLRTDSSRRRVGFVHARGLRVKDRYILPEE